MSNLLNVKTFARIFGLKPTDVESRSAALHAQRGWLEQAAERKRRQDSLINLARELDLEKTARLPKFDRFCNGTMSGRDLMAFRGNAPKSLKAFTLIEMLIVVGIVGILTAIAVPAYQDYTTRAKISEGMALAASAQTAVSEAFQSGGSTGIDAAADAWNTSGPAGGMPSSKYVSAVGIQCAACTTGAAAGGTHPGVIWIHYNQGVLGLGNGQDTVTLTANINGADLASAITNGTSGVIDWGCASGTNTTATAQNLVVDMAGGLLPKFAPSNCR